MRRSSVISALEIQFQLLVFQGAVGLPSRRTSNATRLEDGGALLLAHRRWAGQVEGCWSCRPAKFMKFIGEDSTNAELTVAQWFGCLEIPLVE